MSTFSKVDLDFFDAISRATESEFASFGTQSIEYLDLKIAIFRSELRILAFFVVSASVFSILSSAYANIFGHIFLANAELKSFDRGSHALRPHFNFSFSSACSCPTFLPIPLISTAFYGDPECLFACSSRDTSVSA